MDDNGNNGKRHFRSKNPWWIPKFHRPTMATSTEALDLGQGEETCGIWQHHAQARRRGWMERHCWHSWESWSNFGDAKIIQNQAFQSLGTDISDIIWLIIRWPLQIFTIFHHYSPTTSYNLIHSCHSSNANDVMSRMTSRVNQLHDELALESVTNIEFEQSSWPWLAILGPGKVKKNGTGYLWHLGTGNKRHVYLCGSDYSIL